ncbi:hypothetical protein L916_09193 [Phytophthora nicotianae]|uniref:Uncharacterized protein n=1 Tax=Phytophthora nicotianae TaxID=4792 RepID=W2J116_PHYNI|nr:hypothetical protein L916_09193 [Phytophthora nicotianae]
MSSSSSSDDSYDSCNSDDGYGSYDTTDELDLGHLFDSDDDCDDEEEIVDLGTTSTLRKTYQWNLTRTPSITR